MKHPVVNLVISVVILFSAILPGGVSPASAQAPQGPGPAYPPGEPCQDENGVWYMPESAASGMPQAPSATDGPDDYGYTWNDSEPFNWVDARGGTDVGFSGLTWDMSDAIGLGFEFPFYENTYNEVYISPSGYLTFTRQDVDWQSEIPYPVAPNNIIAPFWSPLMFSNTGPGGRVYYKVLGVSPNRKLVVEWYQVFFGDEKFTFEVELQEDGDIVFRYQEMIYNGSAACASAGIEAEDGVDGLTYLDFCVRAPTTPKAVLIKKPAPSARVKASPLYNGQLIYSNQTNSFDITVKNTGDLGSDIYDFVVDSAWPVTLFEQDGVTELSDHDDDGKVDSGPLQQGASYQVLARVTAPGSLVQGDANVANIEIRSSLNLVKAKIVELTSTVPAPFTQVYRDQNEGGMSLDLNWPAGQRSFATGNPQGTEPAVVQTYDKNFVYIWAANQQTAGHTGSVLQYAVFNPYGQVIRPSANLTQLSGAAGVDSYDSSPALAAIPAAGGSVGVTWYNYLDKLEGGVHQYQYNVYFAILSSTGELTFGPLKVTQIASWFPSGNDLVQINRPSIAASGNKHFMIGWQQSSNPGGAALQEIFFTIRDDAGAQIKAVTKMADGSPGSLYYSYPGLTALTGDRFLLAYYYYKSSPLESGIRYRVYGSAGGVNKPEIDAGIFGRQSDAVQFTDGNVLLAANAGEGITYTILKKSDMTPLDAFNALSHPSALIGTTAISVTKAGNWGILTWKDALGQHLYYTLVDSSGGVVNAPSIYRAAERGQSEAYLETSVTGYGITTNTWSPKTGVNTFASFNAQTFNAIPGMQVPVQVDYGNHGFTTATQPVLTVTLADGLIFKEYAGGSSCNFVEPILTCNFQDMDFLDAGKIILTVEIPAVAAVGVEYLLNAEITSTEPDAVPDNNIDETRVVSAHPIFLPLIRK